MKNINERNLKIKDSFILALIYYYQSIVNPKFCFLLIME